MEVVDGGIIYRNPKPHVRSRHAYFPSVVNLGDGELLCSFVLGEAFESADCRVFLARSHDNGATWALEGRMLPEPAGVFSESCRIMRCKDGSLVADVFRYDRRRPNQGLTNPETLGFVETQILIFRSADKGRTWTGPEEVKPPLVGPEFELCSPVVELEDGKWLLPTSTWSAWDGANPTGMKAIAFMSDDHGKSWLQYVDVMDGIKDSVIYWEQKIVELQPGRLLAVAWAYDEANKKSLPNAYCISENSGQSFSERCDTALAGETPTIIPLNGEEALCVYRRVDEPGLWAAEISVKDGNWETGQQLALWGAPSILTAECSENRSEQFGVLRFGAPCAVRLDNGDIFIAFWCVEDCVSNIRSFRLRLVQ